MPKDRKRPTDIDFTEAELEMFGDYTDAERAGGNSVIGEYLKRCPGSETKMRPILETALRLGRASSGLRCGSAASELARLLALSNKHKTDKK